MKKLKYQILFIILFITIGIAAVTSNLVINGNTNIASNPDDFLVYFSDAKINGVQDLSLVDSETSLVFNKELSAVGQNIVITYDITNASKNYDADVNITCTQSTEYLTISNSFDTDSYLSARSTRSGVLTIILSKSYTGADLKQDISCTINASAVERNSQGSGIVSTPVIPYYTGREITIGTEKYNIISTNDDTVTMLAQYNVDEDGKQSRTEHDITFSEGSGWDDSEPTDIEWPIYTSTLGELIMTHLDYLNTNYNIEAEGNLITLKELGDLGCTVPTDYIWNESEYYDCADSPHREWLINGQSWWTRSAHTGSSDVIWFVHSEDYIDCVHYESEYSVRPTITVTKKVANLLIYDYEIGKEISIGDEKFNVISNNGTTVSLLAQYNLGTDYKQSKTNNYVKFADTYGWDITPGPKEIDIQTWSTNPKIYVNAYVEFLRAELEDDSVTGGLITLTELKGLGCTINDDYSWTGFETCANSSYKSWLVTDQYWWTRSASSEYDDLVWYVHSRGALIFDIYSGNRGVRPVITISKDTLKNLN